MKNNLAMKLPSTENKAHTNLLEIIFQERLKYSALVSSAIDHGLHTPMIIIKGLAEMSLRNPNQDPRANLKKISNEADHVLKLLAAMTFVVTTETLQMQNLSLKNVIDRVVIFFEKRCLQNGISLKVDVSESLRVEADPNRLRNILISIIQNAVDSFEKVPASAPRSILIHTQNHRGHLDLVISDTGTGISSEIQDQIINKILSNKASETPLSSYLGLALAKKMSDDIGLKLGFVSASAKGTSFTVSFPKNKA